MTKHGYGFVVLCLAGLSLRYSLCLAGDTCRFQGRVVDAEAMVPLDGARIFTEGEKGRQYLSNQSGDFVALLKAEMAILRIECEGYVATTFRIENPAAYRAGSQSLPLLPLEHYLGKIVDARTFLPIREASVRFMDKQGQTISEVVADDRGEFSLLASELQVNIGEGNVQAEGVLDRAGWLLDVRADGYYPLYPADMRYVLARQVYSAGKRILVTLDRVDRVQGIVTDPEGVPISGATVAWSWQVIKGFYTFRGYPMRTKTNQEGGFVWHAPNSVCRSLIIAKHPRYGPGVYAIDRSFKNQGLAVRIALTQKGKLQGKIVGPEGQGVQGAKIRIVPTQVPRFWSFLSGDALRMLYGRGIPWQEVTGDDGSFMMDGMPVGQYHIRLEHSRLVDTQIDGHDVTVGESSNWEGRMVAGRELRGTIFNEEGEYIPNVQVVFQAKQHVVWSGILAEDECSVDWAPVKAHVVFIDKNAFCGRQLPHSTLRVIARAAGYRSSVMEIDQQKAVVKFVLIRQKGEGESAKKAAGFLQFEFVWQDCWADLDMVNISLYSPGEGHRVTIRSAEARMGMSALGDLPCGTFDVLVAPYGYQPSVFKNVVIPNKNSIRVKLVPAPILSGEVHAKGALREVSIVDGQDHELRSCVVEKGGEFVIWGLTPGFYRVRGRDLKGVEYISPTEVEFSASTPTIVRFDLPDTVRKRANSE